LRLCFVLSCFAAFHGLVANSGVELGRLASRNAFTLRFVNVVAAQHVCWRSKRKRDGWAPLGGSLRIEAFAANACEWIDAEVCQTASLTEALTEDISSSPCKMRFSCPRARQYARLQWGRRDDTWTRVGFATCPRRTTIASASRTARFGSASTLRPRWERTELSSTERESGNCRAHRLVWRLVEFLDKPVRLGAIRPTLRQGLLVVSTKSSDQRRKRLLLDRRVFDKRRHDFAFLRTPALGC
jgi:hypothetical protein